MSAMKIAKPGIRICSESPTSLLALTSNKAFDGRTEWNIPDVDTMAPENCW